MPQKKYFRLVITSKDNKRRQTQAGAAFLHEPTGAFNLVLSPGVVLTSELMRDNYLTLYPRSYDVDPQLAKENPVEEPPRDSRDEDDDIPF